MTGGKVVTYCAAWSDSAWKVLNGWCSGCKAGICKEMRKKFLLPFNDRSTNYI